MLHDVQRLLWPGNSPDLNAIEPAWFWMKRRTTAQGATTNRAEMERRWYKAWEDLPQETIQAWISWIPHHIQEVIRVQGGNDFDQGGPGFKRCWKGDRLKGHLSTGTFIDPSRSAGQLTPAVVQEKLPKAVQKNLPQHQERQDSIPIQNSDSEVSGDEDDWLWDDDAGDEYEKRYGI
jgi:hypothetical protein